MAYIVSLSFRPERRYDAEPWTQARVEYKATQDDPYTAIETRSLSPVDTDPREPREREFTVESPVEKAWYRAVFLDAEGDTQATSPVYHLPPGLRPTVEDVGTLLRARTKDSAGVEQGAFTATTRPSATQVDRLIDTAINDVAAWGGYIPPGAEGAAREAAILRAAMLIELSHYPEQAGQENSIFDALRTMWEASSRRLDELFAGSETSQGVASVPVTTLVAMQEEE